MLTKLSPPLGDLALFLLSEKLYGNMFMTFMYESFSAASVQWTLDTFKILKCLLLGSLKKKLYI